MFWTNTVLPTDKAVLRSDFTSSHRYIGLPHSLFLTFPYIEAHVRYDLAAVFIRY